MKYLAWLVGIFSTLLIMIYVVIFTNVGNKILQPHIEDKIQKEIGFESKLTTFMLGLSDFSIVLEVSQGNVISVKGDYSLFKHSFNIDYIIGIKKLEAFKSITNAPIQGEFKTQGNIEGTLADINIDGISDFALSETNYHIVLRDFNPTSIVAKVKKVDLASLLYLGGEKSYATGKMDVDINFKNITPHLLDGNIVVDFSHDVIDSTLPFNIYMYKDSDTSTSIVNFNSNGNEASNSANISLIGGQRYYVKVNFSL